MIIRTVFLKLWSRQKVYPNYWLHAALLAFIVYVAGTTTGCTIALTSGQKQDAAERVVRIINERRSEVGLSPLVLDAAMSSASYKWAEKIAARETAATDPKTQKRLISEGCYARFALNHSVRGNGIKGAVNSLLADPRAMSMSLHEAVDSAGVGIAQGGGLIYLVLDLAHLTPVWPQAEVRKDLLKRIQEKRRRNSAGKLELHDKLEQTAQKIAQQFIDEQIGTDELLANTQSELDNHTFDLGRVLVAFQAVGSPDQLVIPHRTFDPALGYFGLALAQGNHPDHDPGAIVFVLVLAESQEKHSSDRATSSLPPPKALTSRKKKQNETGSPVEQAWTATLVGNHAKAAELFTKAYRQTKKKELLYESARAHARNEDFDEALTLMKEYESLAGGKKKKEAGKMIAKLEKGESIFATSKETTMSVEAQRFFVIGQRLFEQNEWDGAIDAFQQAYIYAKHPDIVYNIGLVHSKAGRIGDALDFFAEYQRVVPEATSVEQAQQMFAMGLELYSARMFEEASRNFALAYAFLPLPEIIYNLAMCHKELGENKEAVQFLREYLDTDPPASERSEIEQIIKNLE